MRNMLLIKYYIRWTLLIFTLFIFPLTIAKGISKYEVTPDSAFKKLESYRTLASQYSNKNDEIEILIKETMLHQKYIREGMKIWAKYPSDKRRYDWIANAIRTAPNFMWKNIPEGANSYLEKQGTVIAYSAEIDGTLYAQWHKNISKYKKNYFSYLDSRFESVKDQTFEKYRLKHDFLAYEILQNIRLHQNSTIKSYSGNILDECKIILNQAQQLGHFENFTSIYTSLLSYWLVGAYSQLGISKPELTTFLHSLNFNETFNKWRTKKTLLLNSDITLFELTNPTITNISQFTPDLKNLKGQVILLDFWGRGCASCIARMPYLNELYKKYKKDGFIVLSMCIENIEDLKLIEQIKVIHELEIPILLCGQFNKQGSYANIINEKFGLTGVPHYFLFNQQGELVKYNDILNESDFEIFLKKQLYKTN